MRRDNQNFHEWRHAANHKHFETAPKNDSSGDVLLLIILLVFIVFAVISMIFLK